MMTGHGKTLLADMRWAAAQLHQLSFRLMEGAACDDLGAARSYLESVQVDLKKLNGPMKDVSDALTREINRAMKNDG